MKFLNENFLLTNDTARELFWKVSKPLPIVDYHNHLDPKSIAEDAACDSIARLLVLSDPYKHRAMRINGVPEREISGDASEAEKFFAWARTCPNTWGNPLFHWSAMELKSMFGIDDVLCAENAGAVMKKCDGILKAGAFSVNSILRKWNIDTLCTSDDLLDDVSVHKAATAKARDFSVLPSLRADSIFAFGTPNFGKWSERLSAFAPIKNLDGYLDAIRARLDAFDDAKCRLADHSLDSGFVYDLPSAAAAEKIFAKAASSTAADCEIVKLKSYIMRELACEYAKRGWVLQLHIGAERFTSSRLRSLSGPAGGYASIGNSCDIKSLVRFIDDAEKAGGLPKIILYTLNPADNQALSTLTGSFAQDGVWGKLQFGPAWWYNDHIEGIRAHLRSLSSFGLLSRFIGMTTDSRSILSFSRHEYFRRLLCDYVGALAERGEIPSDFDFLSRAVADISYNNSKNWIF